MIQGPEFTGAGPARRDGADVTLAERAAPFIGRSGQWGWFTGGADDGPALRQLAAEFRFISRGLSPPGVWSIEVRGLRLGVRFTAEADRPPPPPADTR